MISLFIEQMKQGVWVQCLVWEDSTWQGQLKSVGNNY